MKRQKEIYAKKVKYKVSTADRIISVLTYVIYTIFAFVCVYPFYYIFINTISSNDLSQRGKVLFWPKELHFNNYKQVMQSVVSVLLLCGTNGISKLVRGEGFI